MGHSLDRLARRIDSLDRRIRALALTPRLDRSSVDDGTLDFTTDGVTSIVVGQQPDGTNAPVVVSGPTPPGVVGLSVAPYPGGLLVTWNGMWAEGLVAPLDFASVEVHVSTEGPNFLADLVGADSTTLAGSISSPRGGRISVDNLEYVPHWVRLAPRTLPGKWGEPTGAYGPTTPAKVDTQDINPNAVTEEQIADQAVQANHLAAGAVHSDALADFAVLLSKVKSTNHVIH